MRNSVLSRDYVFGGSEIRNPFRSGARSEFLNPLLRSLGIRNSESSLSYVLIRNSESFPAFFGGSEILSALLCYFEDQKF